MDESMDGMIALVRLFGWLPEAGADLLLKKITAGWLVAGAGLV